MRAAPERDGIHFGDVPAADVAIVWPFVERFMADACGYSDDDLEPEQLLAQLVAGERMLWVAHDGTEVLMGLVTDVYETANRRICLILTAGGHPRVPWDWIAGVIEQFAAERGCHKVRIVGRKGWMAKLPTYRATCVVLSKDLTHVQGG